MEGDREVADSDDAAVRGGWVDVRLVEVKGEDAADGDHGRGDRAGEGHEDQDEEGDDALGAEEGLDGVGHHEPREDLTLRELAWPGGEQWGVVDGAGCQPDDRPEAPGDAEDGDRGQIVAGNGGVDFRREGLLPESGVLRGLESLLGDV